MIGRQAVRCCVLPGVNRGLEELLRASAAAAQQTGRGVINPPPPGLFLYPPLPGGVQAVVGTETITLKKIAFKCMKSSLGTMRKTKTSLLGSKIIVSS